MSDSSSNASKTTLALTMIVKNETKVLPRLFDSCYKYLDYYCIHDTGSTDGTPEFIKKYFDEKGIPGEIHHTPWTDFGFNRSRAVESVRGKADYTLLFDADFILNVKDENFKEQMGQKNADGYLLKYEGGLDYRQNLLVRTKLNWFYKGVTHEFIHSTEAKRVIPFDGITVIHKADGGCRDDKFERDIALLEKGVKEEPNNGRYYFYLGQSYKDMGIICKNKYEYSKRLVAEIKKKLEVPEPSDELKAQLPNLKEQMEKAEKDIEEFKVKYMENFEKCLPAYQRRVDMGGWGEEVYYARLQQGLAKMRMEKTFYDFMPNLLSAYMGRPQRLEALFYLVRHCRLNNMHKLGYAYARMAIDAEYPKDLLFIDKGIHLWGFWDELALLAHHNNDFEVALRIGERLLREKHYPDREKPRLTRNMAFFKKKLEEQMLAQGKTLSSSSVMDKNILAGKSELVVDSSGKSSVQKSSSTHSGEFIRIDPENKNNRLAVIITNYNMVERADALAQYIKDNVKYPTDVILVDNGSDQTQISKYTSLALGSNVQTTHGWLMGLKYADSLEVFENFKYFAYSFVITSTEIVLNQGDILTKLMRPLVRDDTVVAVHPALTTDSTSWWKHLMTRGTSGFRLTNMIDNIFSIYRADWYNKQGRFDESLTYAWGIDMEFSYYARRDNMKILVADDILVKKVTNIGYQMNRMNMSGEDRFKNARAQIQEYFTKKYGDNYNNIVGGAHRIQEFTPYEKNSYIEKMRETFGSREGGHRLLIEYLDEHHQEYKSKFGSQNPGLLEIGCTREEWSHLNSTYKLEMVAQELGMRFTTIDMDQDAINRVKQKMISPQSSAIAGSAESVIPQLNEKYHFVYLDGYDITLSETHHNEVRKDQYRKYLKKEMSNDQCYQMHLTTVKYLDDKLCAGGLLCFNDIISLKDYSYKGKLAIPYLLRTGRYRIVKHEYNALLLEKTANSDDENTKTVREQTWRKVSNPKDRFIVTLLGYTREQPKHTNWYPWNRFLDVYQKMGYRSEWTELSKLMNRGAETDPQPRIFICWNEPTCVELVRSRILHKDDVIIQKLTSLGKGSGGVNWGNNPKEFFSKWHWPIYQTVEYLLDEGFNIYAFGCHSHSEDFPEKRRIVEKLEKMNRLFWINWGSTMFDYDEVKNCQPVTDNFQYDMAYVGSKWGQAGRGNVDQWNSFIEPVVKMYPDKKYAFYGGGFPEGPIPDVQAKEILRRSKICPILHAPSWVAEKGVQDRFYSVFTAGRFGVCDNEGVYDFFNQDEVVVELNPEKYREKTVYFMENTKEQTPYIEKVQDKIRSKYNLYTQWDEILTQIIQEQQEYQPDSYELLSNVNRLSEKLKFEPFYENTL